MSFDDYSSYGTSASKQATAMAYVPPHRRRLRTVGVPSRNLVRSGNTNAGIVVYGWFSVGRIDGNPFPLPALPQSVPNPMETTTTQQQQIREEVEEEDDHLASSQNSSSLSDDEIEKPWVDITERVLQDLISCFRAVRNERQSGINSDSEDLIRSKLVVRVGKIHFLGAGPSSSGDDAGKVLVTDALKRYFCSNVSPSYVEDIVDVVVPKIGLEFEHIKYVYHLKFSDSSRPGTTISCKCRLIEEENRLELFKIEQKEIHRLVYDITCLGKDQDLRLMLSTKRTLKPLTDDEEECIRDVIGAAILDHSAGGGLRWPGGKPPSGDQFRIVAIWRTAYNSYGDSSMRLKVQDTDRFDFRTLVGEVTSEITLKLKGITSELLENEAETDGISDMLKDAMKLLWEHF